MKNPLKTRYVIFKLKDDILQVKFRKTELVDLEMAREIVDYRMEFQGDRPMAILCDARKIAHVDGKARNHFGTEGSLLIIALAILVKPGNTMVLAKYYMERYINEFNVSAHIEKSAAKEFLNNEISNRNTMND
jgi:hypothetical protein